MKEIGIRENIEDSAKTRGFYKKLCSFDFFDFLDIIIFIFEKWKQKMQYYKLQNPKKTFDEMLRIIDSLRDILRSY